MSTDGVCLHGGPRYTFQCLLKIDIFYFVLKCIIYNNDDDNTVAYIHKDRNTLKLVLQKESLNLISWFEDDFMKATSDKFQAICAGNKCHDTIKSFRIGDTDISCEDNVSLLEMNIDFMLKFDEQVKYACICKKATKQLAVLKTLGRF